MKYTIINSSNLNILIILVYIILMATVAWICLQYLPSTENFDNLDNSKLLQELKASNKELQNIKSELEIESKNKERLNFLSQNFNKIVDIKNLTINDVTYPQIDLNKWKIISDSTELKNLVISAKTFKNIYKVGDIITLNSDYLIDKKQICYGNGADELIYPECMVCSIDDEGIDWKNKISKTNINKVCLFDTNIKSTSLVPNLLECQTMCNI